jgi:hypothetical protein
MNKSFGRSTPYPCQNEQNNLFKEIHAQERLL